MAARRWLPTVLKARQAREDWAALKVAQAQREVAEAEAHALAESARLDSLVHPTDPQSLQAFIASAAATKAAAATFAAAQHRITFAEHQVQLSIEQLRDAAKERRAAQKLAEREAEQRRIEALEAEQKELDDLTITRFRKDEATG